MRLQDTLVPLAAAALVPGVVAAVPIVVRAPAIGTGFLLMLTLTWFYSCLAAAVLVLPIFAIAPSFRRPPLWVTTMWGAAIPWVIIALLLRSSGFPSTQGASVFTLSGACAGVVYGLVARRAGIVAPSQ